MLVNPSQLLRQIVEIAPLAVIALDQKGQVKLWNPAAERIFGWPADEVMHRPAPILAAVQRGQFDDLTTEGRADEAWTAAELRCQKRDGTPVEVCAWAAPLRNGAGEIIGAMEIFLDLTERKRAERALEESRQRLQALFDNIRDGILLVDSYARHVDANPALCELLGYSREEMLGMALWDDVPPARREPLYELWGRFLAVGRLEGEFTCLRKDGSTVEVEYRAVANFMPGLHLCTVRDITERRRADDELKEYAAHLKSMSRRLVEAQENERKALARELHDRTGQNLTAINLHLSMIREQFSPLAEKACRARVEDSMALVAETMEAVRDVMANLRPPVLEDYGLLAGLQWYGEIVARRTGLPVEITGEEPSPRLAPMAEAALFRIAQEALTNVIKHAEATRVTVALEGGAQRPRLTIVDDGRGFDFTGERRAGTGWGLLTMQERVEAVGGCLQVDSAPGRGTRVVVEVPPGA